MNIFALLDQAATHFPSAGAIFLGTDLVHSYSQLRSRALKVAAGLRKSDAAGDRIAIFSENCPEYVELMFGVWAAGMVVTPINAKLHPKEALQILEDSGAKRIFVSPKLAAAIRAEIDPHKLGVTVIGTDDYEASLSEEFAEDTSASPDALAWLFYTSGTTGRSKGAMLSHRNLMAMTLAHLADIDAPNSNSSLMHPAPMSHGSGLYIPAYVARGARQVVPASHGFDPEEFTSLCREHPDCSVFLAPTMVQRLRLYAEASKVLPSNLSTVIYGGGPMYVDELLKATKVFGNVFAQIYGQGESPMTITGLSRADHVTDDLSVLGSVGRARTGVEVSIHSDHGETVRVGDVGEIVCRGDVVMSGYWNNPDATAQALKGGWLHTGDMGSFDDHGYLTLRDRSKDVVISGGTNIYPREVEEALLKHPSVQEACIIGKPDPEWGEIVVAFVVRSPGSDVTQKQLDEHCNNEIARFKRPKRYVFVNELPKNNYGKVPKRDLRERLAALDADPVQPQAVT